MKNLFVSLVFGIFGAVSMAFAGPSFENPIHLTGQTYENPPYVLVGHGDNENFKKGYWKELDLYSISKWGGGRWTDESATHNIGFSGPGDSGSWEYTGGPLQDSDSSNNFKFYFSVTAGNSNSKKGGGYNLFAMADDWYDNALNNSVKWSTLNNFFDTTLDDLGNHDISHISFWRGADMPDMPDAPANQTPEPATMVLFGFGLLIFAGVSRRKK